MHCIYGINWPPPPPTINPTFCTHLLGVFDKVLIEGTHYPPPTRLWTNYTSLSQPPTPLLLLILSLFYLIILFALSSNQGAYLTNMGFELP